MAGLDLEHELPPADGDENSSETAAGGAAVSEASGPGAELQKLKAERDSLLADLEAHFGPQRFLNTAAAFDGVKDYVALRAARR